MPKGSDTSPPCHSNTELTPPARSPPHKQAAPSVRRSAGRREAVRLETTSGQLEPFIREELCELGPKHHGFDRQPSRLSSTRQWKRRWRSTSGAVAAR